MSDLNKTLKTRLRNLLFDDRKFSFDSVEMSDAIKSGMSLSLDDRLNDYLFLGPSRGNRAVEHTIWRQLIDVIEPGTLRNGAFIYLNPTFIRPPSPEHLSRANRQENKHGKRR